MKSAIATLLLVFSCSILASQENAKPDLFIDCNINCFFNYVKENITFVDHSLERMEADIFVLVTSFSTGSGGREIQLLFQGNEDFQNRVDTLTFFYDPNDTEFIQRDKLVDNLKKGLLPYIIQTPLMDQLTYEVETSDDSTVVEEEDPWDYWVFSLGGNGWMNGESSFNSLNLNGRLFASRITEEHKFRFSANSRLNRSKFTLTDGETFISEIINYNTSVLYVKSMSPKWSLGLIADAGSSTFSNLDISTGVKPTIEYNLFPYDEAQTKRFTFRYSIGPEYYNYSDSTVFDKLSEIVGRHSLDIEYLTTQKMGDVSLDFGVEQYLHNLNLYNIYFDPSISWQLFKGFRIRLGAFVSWVNDRINIPKESISDEDILLQIRQLDTQFSYFGNFGINFRFGSVKNNFVNARF